MTLQAPALRALVTVDPAARRFAYAISVMKEIRCAAYAVVPAEVQWILEALELRPGEVSWLFEEPQKYERFGKAHKDLDRLLATLDGIRALALSRHEVVRTVSPHEWKGNVPKPAHHGRVLPHLSTFEVRRVDVSSHDVLDAVALNLFGTGRLKRGGRA